MIESICQELNNWFDRDQPKYFGNFMLSGSTITDDFGNTVTFLEGQYFRIVGSVLNDGVYQYSSTPTYTFESEAFANGAIWAMAVPHTVVSLAAEIEDWMTKYAGVDSQAMSPYNSESFGGYSYSKSGGGSGSGSSDGGASWQGVFANRLKPWRKIKCHC